MPDTVEIKLCRDCKYCQNRNDYMACCRPRKMQTDLVTGADIPVTAGSFGDGAFHCREERYLQPHRRLDLEYILCGPNAVFWERKDAGKTTT